MGRRAKRRRLRRCWWIHRRSIAMSGRVFVQGATQSRITLRDAETVPARYELFRPEWRSLVAPDYILDEEPPVAAPWRARKASAASSAEWKIMSGPDPGRQPRTLDHPPRAAVQLGD